MFMVTPEMNLENYESLKKIIPNEEYVVKTSEMERLKELVVFSKTKNPLYGERMDPLDNAKFLIRNGLDRIDVLDAFSLTCCQVGPCEPTIANEIAFEIKPFDDCVEITNKWKDCIVGISIDAGSERTIRNCFDTKLGFNISNENESSHELSMVINGTDSTITVGNASSDKCSVRLVFLLNETLQFKSNDRVVDATGGTILSVEEIVYDDLPCFSGSDISDEWD